MKSGAPTAFASSVDHRERVLVLRADDAGHAALEDAGLLRGDAGEVVAEEILVVVADRRDHRGERRVDDVGGVEAAAEPDLEQRDIGGMLGEEEEGDRRGDLEEGDRLAAIGARARASIAAISSSSSTSTPPPGRPRRMRSLKRTRCGEV